VVQVPSPPPPPRPETFTVFFASNKATLSAQARSEIDRIVARARAIGAKTITLQGHADRKGADAYNERLSQQREAAVHDQIHKAGLNARIEGQAFGEARPAKATADGVSEANNRRVDVVITP
jgi:outer membrane protein OmpA-like peptidoglycan-associated protein